MAISFALIINCLGGNRASPLCYNVLRSRASVWMKITICLRWWCLGVFCVPKTRGFATREKRLQHWSDHEQEFGGLRVAVYESMADRFLGGLVPMGVNQCRRKKGDTVRFNPLTNEFGVIALDGTVRTYFKPMPCVVIRRRGCHAYPDNTTYYQEACKA
jgi:hypothetical protein